MTALEQQLTTALRALSSQYKQAQLQQLEQQVGILTTQYAHITADYKALAKLLNGR